MKIDEICTDSFCYKIQQITYVWNLSKIKRCIRNNFQEHLIHFGTENDYYWIFIKITNSLIIYTDIIVFILMKKNAINLS
jgi:hypothetical protein